MMSGVLIPVYVSLSEGLNIASYVKFLINFSRSLTRLDISDKMLGIIEVKKTLLNRHLEL